jgi:hypothetical protein
LENGFWVAQATACAVRRPAGRNGRNEQSQWGRPFSKVSRRSSGRRDADRGDSPALPIFKTRSQRFVQTQNSVVRARVHHQQLGAIHGNGIVPGKTNFFQFTTNLAGTNPVTWQSLLTNVLATNLFSFVDTNASNAPRLFYRVLETH